MIRWITAPIRRWIEAVAREEALKVVQENRPRFTVGDIHVTIPEIGAGITPTDIDAAVRQVRQRNKR